MTDVPHDAATTLRDRTRGAILSPGDPGYEDARTVWNARIDRHPDLVLRCSGAADVMAGVDVAREHDLRLGVKGGGHHVSGSAVPDGGLLLDLGGIDDVRVDPDARTARVGPGATWGDVDHETQAFGLAVPGGQDPNIGVAGLTLGGVGWLSRKYGLTCDNLRSADVVTAGGAPVHASEDTNPDLFWALRGGGGNFGVVTSFEFQLHEVGPMVLAGSLVYPDSKIWDAARYYREAARDAPREFRLLFGSMVLPQASVYPARVRGERVAIVLACYAGDREDGGQVLTALRDRGDPVMDSIRERPYTAWQQAGDSQGRMRTALRSNHLEALTDDVVEAVAGFAAAAPSAGATVFVSPRGGAETDPPVDATAYAQREPCHHLLVEARWTDPARDAEHVAWVRECHEAVQPYTNGRAALNFLTGDEGGRRVRAAFGENYERLREVKRAWDPGDLFSAPGALEE